MIPRKIELKNFLCYGDTPQIVDFEGYHLICLSGKNGYGKSALLDAMTWCLWGQARKISGTSKPDSGLLRLGQTRMMVSFEFEVNNKIYRIRREYAKTYGKPIASLDFEVYDVTTKAFRSLTDKTIRETQAKIEHTINLDFDTFINTAFLKQGHSNEFSKKTAKERKQILSNILGLTKYDKLQQHALELSKKKVEQKKVLEKIREQQELELKQEPELLLKQETTKAELLSLQKELDELGKEQAALNEKMQNCKQHIAQKNKVTHDLFLLKQEQEKKQKTLREHLIAWKKVHKQLLQVKSSDDLTLKKQQLITSIQKSMEAKQSSLVLQEQFLAQQEHYQKAVARYQQEHEKKLAQYDVSLEKKELELTMLQKQHKQIAQQVDEATKLVSSINNNSKLIEKKLQKLSEELSIQERVKQQFDKRRAFYQNLVQQGNFLKSEQESLTHKTTIIDDEKSPSCPLCQQVLTAKRKSFLHKQFSHEQKFLLHKVSRITNLLPKLKAFLIEQHKTVEILSKKEQEKTVLTAQLDEQSKRLATVSSDLKKYQQQLQQFVQQEEKINQSIKLENNKLEALKKEHKQSSIENEKLAELKQKLEQLVQAKKHIKFDNKKYQDQQKQLLIIEKELQDISQAAENSNQQHERKTVIKQICRDLKHYYQQIESYQKDLASLTLADKEKEFSQQIAQCSLLQNNKMKNKERALQEKGRLEHALDRLQTLKKQKSEYDKERSLLQNEIDDYQTLAHTFSKNGIQALLIEESIPEIEHEANAILAKLTNNQAQIFIESLRDLKKGGVRETLDIKITDEVGIRPYEMFSGGEAFRIDFSLRIAISKLLARRAGTALQTLIIDEGFGSQDEEGLSLLMNAIHAIQQNFSKVIIVSHLSEFKDNFPIHFIVNKLSTGSIISVEERG